MEDEEQFVPTGEGNPELANICWSIFTKTGAPSDYCLYKSLSCSKEEFDAKYLQAQEEKTPEA